jgi:hypothetical protein
MFAEIVLVAKDLRKCAASYIEAVKRKRIVLIAFTRSVGGYEKPFALAEYRIGRHGQWGQMVESCNANASAETRAHFYAMDASLGVWLGSVPIDLLASESVDSYGWRPPQVNRNWRRWRPRQVNRNWRR